MIITKYFSELDYKGIYRKAHAIIFRTQNCWEEIGHKQESIKSIIYNYAFPLVLLIAVCRFLGALLNTDYYNASFLYALFSAGMSLVTTIAIIFLSILLFNFVISYFDIPRNLQCSATIILYGFTPFYFAMAFSSLLPEFSLFVILGMYALSLIWIGTRELLGMEFQYRYTFIFTLFFLFTGLYIFFYTVEGIVTSYIFINSKAMELLNELPQ